MADWYFRNNDSGLVACPGCRNLVKRGQEFCPYCARRLGPEQGLRGWMKRSLRRRFVATRALVGIACAAFLLQAVTDLFVPHEYRSSGGGLFSLLTAQPFTYILMGSNFHLFVAEYGQVWRFVTSCFLHFGLIHILFNGWAFWDLGRLAEDLWGPKAVFATFVITGAAGSAASFLLHAALLGQPVNSAGASGSICGILGLLLGAYYRNRFSIGQTLGPQLVRWAVLIIVFGLVAGADNGAHVGGMAVGALFGYFLSPTGSSRTADRDAVVWNAAAVAALVLLAVSAVLAALFYARGFDNVARLFMPGIV